METTLSEDSVPEKQQYSLTEFIQYMSSDLSVLPLDPPNFYVFWSQDNHHPQSNPPSSTSTTSIEERIKKWLEMTSTFWESLLIQFWEPKSTEGGRRFLTTSRQPFALKKLYKGHSWYRKHCTNHDILVGEEGLDLGPVGRAFLNGHPESSSDLRSYSIKDYPLRDHALRCGFRRYMALPVFELQTTCCTGVLELASFASELPLVFLDLDPSRNVLKSCNLRIPHMGDESMDDDSGTRTEGQKLALSEIKQMFKVVNEIPNITLALAWIPSQECSGSCNCMRLGYFTCDPEWNKQYDMIDNDFLQACWFHKLQAGKGVAGRALSSSHKLCFSRSIYGFNIAEYPLAHYARKAMLSISFAICLQSAHTGSDLYVLEFFLLPGDEDEHDPRSLIHLLLVRMMRQLLSFKVASGHKWGEELLLEILRFPMDDEAVYFQKRSSDGYPLGCKIEYSEKEQRSPFPPIEIRGNTSAITNSSRGEERTPTSPEVEKKVSSFQISYQDLQSQFGKPQKDAANILGVSLSKFKRACRSHNITRWPSHIRNLANNSLFEVRSGPDPGSSRTSAPSTCSNTVQDAKLVTVMANYKSKTYKFQVTTSSGIAELEEQVAKRVKLKIGDFEMSYEDEDGIPILLACDEDFRLCTTSLIGSAPIQLSVAPS